MTYLLTCSCGQEHHVSPTQAGQEIQCTCGESLRIPTLRGIRELPQVGGEPAPETQIGSTSGWGGWRGTALAFASGIAIITGVAATYFLVQRLRIDTSFTEESALAMGNELLEQYGPYELSYVWDTYQTDGLGPKTRPEYYWWNSYAEELVFRSLIMGSVAAVASCIAVGIWFTARRN